MRAAVAVKDREELATLIIDAAVCFEHVGACAVEDVGVRSIKRQNDQINSLPGDP
jgi:hypothetical protein